MAAANTVQGIVSQAAAELGLASSLDVGDPTVSTDASIIRLLALLARAGQELVDEWDWSALRQEWSFVTSQQVAAYPLPPDFKDLLDGTAWNRNTRLPAMPVSARQWAQLKARNTGVVYNVLWRPVQGMFWFYPDSSSAPSSQTISFEYKSKWWLYSAATAPAVLSTGAKQYNLNDVALMSPLSAYLVAPGPFAPFSGLALRCTSPGVSSATVTATYPNATGGVFAVGGASFEAYGHLWTGAAGATVSDFGTTDTPAQALDVPMLDTKLLVAKLRLLWKRETGFDSSQAERDYARAFEAAVSNDVASQDLDIGGKSDARGTLMGPQNFPITGYGQ